MGRRIMIVGNGEIDRALTPAIDCADMVIRFNDCRSAGPDGGRTDIVAVCNTGRPGAAMAGNSGWACNKCVWLASAIWCVRDPAKFAAMRPALAVTHPELDDFCDDHTDAFADYARQNGKDFRIVPAATHEALDRDLNAYEPAPYVCPSSGALLLAEIMSHYRQPDDEVYIAGFGHQGWEGHPWSAERAWMDNLSNEGKLQRLDFSAKYGFPQKVGNS